MINSIKGLVLSIKGMKKILGLVVLATSFGILATSCANLTYAQTNTFLDSSSSATLPGKKGPPLINSTATKSAAKQVDQMANLKRRADLEINRRITALNNAIQKVNSLKRLSSEQKSSFTSQIQAQIDSLTALKAKIDADTDMVTLKTDVKSIVNSYRIYALYIPQISILVASDEVLSAVDQFNTLIVKFQTKIDAAKASGHDVTALQTSLTDMQNKVKDASTQANNASSSALPLTPQGYPGNITALQSARTSLKTARSDLQAARADAHSISKGLKTMNTATSPAKIVPDSTSSATEQ